MSPYDRILTLHELRLFEKDRITIEVLRSCHGNQEPSHNALHTCTVSDAISLDAQLNRNDRSEDLFFIIPQRYSWGELQITRDQFQRILTHFNVFESFLNVAIEFGSKVYHELPRSSTTCFVGQAYSSLCSDMGDAVANCEKHEASYIIHYVERNGRNRGDPWSLRQTGIYSQIDHVNNQSSWIFLQLPNSTRSLLEDRLRWHVRQTASHGDPLALHALLLTTTMSNWGDYVQDMSATIRDLNEKARSLASGTAATQDPGPSLGDMRTLQRMEQKILVAASVLTSNLNVAAELVSQCRLFEASTVSLDQKNRRSIVSYASDMQVHQQNLGIILELLQSTRRIFSQIIETRNVDRLQSSSQTSSVHLDSLRILARDIRDENRTSGVLVAHTHSDTKSMKALTTVATALLPASLVATIFSSSLIQLEQSKEAIGGRSHFVLASQFWIYVLVSLAMTGTTLGLIRALEFWWARRSP